MARRSREILKSEREARCYHIICRVTQRQFWLKQERQKAVLRQQLWKVATFCGVEVLGYCWMDNHVHLLVRVPERQPLSDNELIRRSCRLYGGYSMKARRIEAILRENGNDANALRQQLLARMHDLSQFVKEWKQRFAIWHNRSFKTFGTLWSERFKSLWVEDDARVLRTVSAYIHLNPVRAGMVAHPGEYRFSLYGECCFDNPASAETKQAQVAFCQLMGNPKSAKRARDAFEAFLQKGQDDVGDNIWLKKMERSHFNKHSLNSSTVSMSKGHVIGSKSFVSEWMNHGN